jgi:glycosyltransferase involved in cell wall biosynthesis
VTVFLAPDRNSLNTSDLVRIAYLINQYPAISHSFIRREILALEQLRFEVMRISIRGWDDQLADDQDWAERKRTRYVLRAGALGLIISTVQMMLEHPARFLRALRLAWQMSRHADRPLPVHLIYLAEACRIERWLRRTDVRHVHAHFGTNSAEVAMLVHRLGRQSWSFTVHGPEEFDRAPLIGLASKTRDCSFVVAVCSYGRSQLYRLAEPDCWPKIKVVHCGIDQTFADSPALPPPVARRLVCVGRLCPQKGQLLLIEAARRLAQHGSAYELALVGDGELRPDIEALLTRHNLHGVVRITGWLSSDKVREEILAARALVLPSFAEGLPVVLMEAMALRRPVISTYVAGIPELVIPGEHGWLVPAGDIDALTQAMKTCLDTPPETLTRMGETAHQRALERHDVKHVAAELGALFKKFSEKTCDDRAPHPL